MYEGYDMYLFNASDTQCGDEKDDTTGILLYMRWYDRAKKLMKLRGKTQEDLKRIFHVETRGAVGHYLSGRRQPSPDQIIDLAEALECRLDWLLRNVGPSDREQGVDMHLSSEAEQLAFTFQNLPVASRMQVLEFIRVQIKLIEEHPEIFVTSADDKKPAETSQTRKQKSH
jgi:transcriptional regulator with XRE-family HTH domain